jgi:PPE-repeat protein
MATWHGLPPEANTGRLIAGALAEPYLQAQTAWQTLASEFTAAMSMLTAEIAQVAALWQGMAAEQAQAAFAPYLAWMELLIAMAEQRAAAAGAQAVSYGTAVATTPTLMELAENHITHAILEATNFLGINLVPIAVNEAQYFIELWNRAAVAMDEYAAATGVNTTFPPFPIAPPIMAMPGAPEAGLAAVLAQTAAALPNSIARDFVLTALEAQSAIEVPKGDAQLAAAMAGQAANLAQNSSTAGAQNANPTNQAAPEAPHQVIETVSQLATQGPSMITSLPQQLGQFNPGQLMQLAGQPLQQITSLFTQGLGSNLAGQGISHDQLVAHFGTPEQMGLYGTSPFGSAGGAYSGAGLLTSQSTAPPLRNPDGWSPPAEPPKEERAQLVSTTTTPGSGTGAMGTGTSMMGPVSAAAHSRSESHTAVLARPAAEEEPVVAALGFEAFDDEA